MTSQKKGMFIVFEGCDGCGKTSQTKLLQESKILSPSINIVFPDRTTVIGKIISDYLQKKVDIPDKAVHLLYTANRWELADMINKNIEEGVSIICDRYWYSGAAYDIAKGLSKEWCLAPEEGLPVPDAVIFIDVDPKLLLSRRGFGEERYEKLEFQQKVREAFLSLKSDNWYIIDGSKPFDQVTSDINEIIEKIHK